MSWIQIGGLFTGESKKHVLLGLILGLLFAVFFITFYLDVPLHRAITGATMKSSPPTQTKTRLLCMIFTRAKNWDTKARAIKNTWARRCYRSVFFYSRGNRKLPGAVALNISEGRKYLTEKTRAAVQWSYDNFRGEVDWYLKADDDAYFLMENLELYLQMFDLSKPHYVGKNNKKDALNSSFASGGAGYVLNTGAVELLLNGPTTHTKQCRTLGKHEDVDIAECLRAQGVSLENTLDGQGRQRLHCNDPIHVLSEGIESYYITKGDFVHGSKKASNWMMSPEFISFHYVTPANMYVYDYLLYDVVRIESKL